MVNFPPGSASLSHAASFGAEQRGWREGSGGVGWWRVRPSSSQFDGLELIWMFASAEMNFSCLESISQRKKPTKCCSVSAFNGSVGTFFLFMCVEGWSVQGNISVNTVSLHHFSFPSLQCSAHAVITML